MKNKKQKCTYVFINPNQRNEIERLLEKIVLEKMLSLYSEDKKV